MQCVEAKERKEKKTDSKTEEKGPEQPVKPNWNFFKPSHGKHHGKGKEKEDNTENTGTGNIKKPMETLVMSPP